MTRSKVRNQEGGWCNRVNNNLRTAGDYLFVTFIGPVVSKSDPNDQDPNANSGRRVKFVDIC